MPYYLTHKQIFTIFNEELLTIAIEQYFSVDHSVIPKSSLIGESRLKNLSIKNLKDLKNLVFQEDF